MFKKVNKKLKTLSKIMCILGIVLCVAFAAYAIYNSAMGIDYYLVHDGRITMIIPYWIFAIVAILLAAVWYYVSLGFLGISEVIDRLIELKRIEMNRESEKERENVVKLVNESPENSDEKQSETKTVEQVNVPEPEVAPVVNPTESVEEKIETTVEDVKENLEEVKEDLTEKVVEPIEEKVNDFEDKVVDVVEDVKEDVQNSVENIQNNFEDVKEAVNETVEKVEEKTDEFVDSVVDMVKPDEPQVVEPIVKQAVNVDEDEAVVDALIASMNSSEPINEPVNNEDSMANEVDKTETKTEEVAPVVEHDVVEPTVEPVVEKAVETPQPKKVENDVDDADIDALIADVTAPRKIVVPTPKPEKAEGTVPVSMPRDVFAKSVEDKVEQTKEDVKETVNNIVEDVKEKVEDTVAPVVEKTEDVISKVNDVVDNVINEEPKVAESVVEKVEEHVEKPNYKLEMANAFFNRLHPLKLSSEQEKALFDNVEAMRVNSDGIRLITTFNDKKVSVDIPAEQVSNVIGHLYSLKEGARIFTKLSNVQIANTMYVDER